MRTERRKEVSATHSLRDLISCFRPSACNAAVSRVRGMLRGFRPAAQETTIALEKCSESNKSVINYSKYFSQMVAIHR